MRPLPAFVHGLGPRASLALRHLADCGPARRGRSGAFRIPRCRHRFTTRTFDRLVHRGYATRRLLAGSATIAVTSQGRAAAGILARIAEARRHG